MQGKYEIYWRKEQNGTPNEPISPTNEATTSPKNSSSTFRKTAMIATGAIVARKAIGTVRQEIKASGNERLQSNIDRAMQGLGYVTAIVAAGPTGAVLVGADVVFGAISYNRQLQRDNTNARIQRELNGKRVNIASGSVYYD